MMNQETQESGPSITWEPSGSQCNALVDQVPKDMDSHFGDYMNLFSLWSDDSSWLEENPLAVPQPLQNSQRASSSFERLPVEILGQIMDLTGMHDIKNATNMALACRRFKNIWDSRTRNIHRILKQGVGEAVLPAAILAVQVICFARAMKSKKHKSRRVYGFFKKPPAQRLIQYKDVQWRMAREIQKLNLLVDKAVEPYRASVPGAPDAPWMFGVGLNVMATDSEMDRIRRALFIVEYLKALYTLTRFSRPNRPRVINAHFHLSFLHCFSEIELRQVLAVVKAKIYEFNDLFTQYRPYYQRICCRLRKVCPVISNLVWRLTLAEELQIKTAFQIGVKMSRILKMLRTRETVGISLSRMRRMFRTHFHESAHLICRMRQYPRHVIQYWRPHSRHRLSPVNFFQDCDPGPADLIQWHYSQVAQADPQLLREERGSRIEKSILLRQRMSHIDPQEEELCWGSPKLIWFDRERLSSIIE